MSDTFLTFSLGCNTNYAMHTRDIIQVYPNPDVTAGVVQIHGRTISVVDICKIVQTYKQPEICSTCSESAMLEQLIVIRLTGSETYYGFKIHKALDIIEYSAEKLLPHINKPGTLSVVDGIIHKDDKFTFVINEQTLAQQLVTDNNAECDIELF